MSEINYTANPNDTKEGFELIPAGDYAAVITASEVKETKAGNGNKYLNLTWSIVDGQCKGRTLFEILNLWNANQQAVEISRRAMNKICSLAGYSEGVKNSEELHNKPMLIKVGVGKDKNGNDSNNINEHSEYKGPGVVSTGEKKGKIPWNR